MVASGPRPASPSTCVVLGAAGQLGRALCHTLAHEWRVVPVSRATCDLTDAPTLRRLLHDAEPTLIVNAAAYNAVDRAESDPEAARAVNARLPAWLGTEARALGARVVHYSTDFVFDGAGGAPYDESAAPAPVNAYGRSKREGEERLLATGADALVIRTSWVLGAVGDNFARRILRLAMTRDQLAVVTDETSIPTAAPDLAAATAALVRRADVGSGAGRPLLHLACGGATSRFAYARHVLAAAEAAGLPLRVTAERIAPTTAAAFAAPARRPIDSRLDSGLAARTFGLVLPDWRDAVAPVLTAIVDAVLADRDAL